VIDGADQRIVECGAATGFDVLQSGFELTDVPGIVLIEECVLAEIDDENLVAFLAAFHQLHSSLVNFGPLGQHRA